ncbi:MAG: methyltransferase domain-containing protein [Campylobacterota bacterium]|nr:methyltransferase domain-containing protein [Campylobacterota bacterium]
MTSHKCTCRSSNEILQWFKENKIEKNEVVELELLEEQVLEIGYKSFIDLAQIFFMKMLTPTLKKDIVTLRFQKLNLDSSFHAEPQGSEKYGVNSTFFKLEKSEKFSFLYYYKEALNALHVKSKRRVLNIGINGGDEFKVIQDMLTCSEFERCEFVGIDYSKSAIEYASNEFKSKNVKMYCHDINHLNELNLAKFDMIISIGTLQSSNIKFNETFMTLFQNQLEIGGSVLLGFPNCRWIDSEMIYGAKPANYSFSELSVVLKDIHFCKKYLQQKKYRVTITGKDYLFLSASKII